MDNEIDYQPLLTELSGFLARIAAALETLASAVEKLPDGTWVINVYDENGG
jgi:hypothetical protein